MSEIEGLLDAYEQTVRVPWQRDLAGPQKAWCAIYDPVQERRLRLRLADFQIATEKSGHSWKLVDITGAFAEWMARHRYRNAYFEEPDDMKLALDAFAKELARAVIGALNAPDTDENTVVAILGLASLVGLARASALLDTVAPSVRGRLLIFFPGHYENSNYRLLDARDGWNYLAVPITATPGK